MPDPLQPPPAHAIFVTEEGLRPIWSLLLFILLVATFYTAGQTLAQTLGKLHPADTHGQTAGHIFFGEAALILYLTLAAWMVSLLERRPFAGYGLGGTQRLRNLGQGLLTGFAALSLLVASLRALHLLAFDDVALHGTQALVFGLKWAAAFLLVGLFEEFCFRGFLQFTLARIVANLVRAVNPDSEHAQTIGFGLAAFVLSFLLFTYAHSGNEGETAVGLLAVGVAGLTLAFSLWRTGALWWAIGFHAAWDWAQSFFYGVADSGGTVQGHLLASHPTGNPILSGGTTGPEGSLLVLPTLLLVALLIHRTQPPTTA
jgi:membrane protease YdiL (CAAX protease family)